jgi:hypothetical protein
MLSIDKLVPGFDRALGAIPGGVEMARVLGESTDEGNLPVRTSALIRVAVAQRAGSPYARWVMSRMAARQWVGSEDVFLATAGTARDPIEKEIVRAATRMATAGRNTHPSEFDALASLLGTPKATEVVAQVALAMLTCEALNAIAPATGGTPQPSPKGAKP